MLLCYNNHIGNKAYVDAIEQNALSRRVSSLSGGGGTGAISGGSMVILFIYFYFHFDLGLHRLTVAADGGGSGDYS